MTKGRMLVLIAVVVMMAAAVASAQVRGMGRINGIVTDQAGTPLDGVIVKTYLSGDQPIESKTDGKGNWLIGGIGRGTWVVDFMKPGYTPKRVKLVVEKELSRSEEVKVVLTKS